MRSLFVTGTGTGVGKTVVTAAVCVATGARAMKPVQTGTLEPADLAFVWKATGEPDDVELACPYRFAEPLAPAVASRRAGAHVDVARLASCYRTMAERGPVVVEGAGGLLVPLDRETTMADLAASLDLPVVVASAPGLGTLNHTALTVEAARRRGLEVLGIVISGMPPQPSLAERTNPAELARFAPLIGAIPHLPGLDVEAGEPDGLADVAVASLAPPLGGTFDATAFLRPLEAER